jgi:predicted DNA-binding transcriptional regulator YafY
MSLSKQAVTRYQIIDKELFNHEYVKTSQFQKAIKNVGLEVSTKMINIDLKAMREDRSLGYNAPIAYCTSRKAYYYTNPEFTIREIGLKEADIRALQFFVNAIDQYKNYEVFKDFGNVIDKILDAVAIRKGISTTEKARIIVQTQKHPKATGSNWIPKAIEAIDSSCYLEFKYQKFEDDESKAIKLQPYLLKEDRNLWYILGIDYKGRIRTYALDRVIELTVSEQKFIPCVVDFENYFKHSFGVTVNDDENPVTVVLSFTPQQGKYIQAVSIHPTQEVLIDNSEEYRISVKVQPSYEFYEKILGYGEHVKVISPQKVVNHIKDRLHNMAIRYQ